MKTLIPLLILLFCDTSPRRTVSAPFDWTSFHEGAWARYRHWTEDDKGEVRGEYEETIVLRRKTRKQIVLEHRRKGKNVNPVRYMRTIDRTGIQIAHPRCFMNSCRGRKHREVIRVKAGRFSSRKQHFSFGYGADDKTTVSWQSGAVLTGLVRAEQRSNVYPGVRITELQAFSGRR